MMTTMLGGGYDFRANVHRHGYQHFGGGVTDEVVAVLQRLFGAYGGEWDGGGDGDGEFDGEDFTCDEFRMYEFKVRRCPRGRSHDWTDCPFVHPGEKARRRDPRRFQYSGTACPEFRKGGCRRGDSCEFAHGVFESWLHPSRYRTQPCKDGVGCRRRVCFFAHTPQQLRVVPAQGAASSPKATPDSYDGSPLRRAGAVSTKLHSSSTTSPPRSPTSSDSSSPLSLALLLPSLTQLSINEGNPVPIGWDGRGLIPFSSAPPASVHLCRFDNFDLGLIEEEPSIERVESGRALRQKIFERLSNDGGMSSGFPSY